MRNAALVLGLLGGLLALATGFGAYAYTEVLTVWVAAPDVLAPVENAERTRFFAVAAPALGIGGAALAPMWALWGGAMMAAAAAAVWHAFGIGLFTVFPLVFLGLGALLAIAAGRPDRPVAHF